MIRLSLAASLTIGAGAVLVRFASDASPSQSWPPGTVVFHTMPNVNVFATLPQFRVVSHGGKCLAFSAAPQVAGSPVFLDLCGATVQVQELNDRHEVILRAGTKVIGVKGLSPSTSAGDSGPVVRDHRGDPVTPRRPPITLTPRFPPIVRDHRGETLPPVNGLPPSALELEDLQNPPGAGQVFALDGDSILLASDRTRAVMVEANRGVNGTPLVLGPRELADAEFWTFVAADGSQRRPTRGFVQVRDRSAFLKAVAEGHPGTVVEVDPDVSIDLSGEHVPIPGGVTIRGGRRRTTPGAELSLKSVGQNGTFLDVQGNDVRITGLRLRGPSADTDDDGSAGRAILTDGHSFVRTVVDHNEIHRWPEHAVDVWGDRGAPEVCRDHRDPRQFRTPQVRVTRNSIHTNRRQNAGYGIEAHYGGFPLVTRNMFVANRHAIMADGKACSSYLAWYNLVLERAPWQRKLGVPLWHTHDFDSHGTGDNGFGGRAGQFFEIARNTFLGRNRHNYELRGEPVIGVEFHHNVSRQDRGDAVSCDDCGGGEAKIKVTDDNAWEVGNPTLRLGVGDFDGDGIDDTFLATGAAWYYSPGGRFDWRFLSAQTEGIDGLRFGDFDADGRTDVFTQRGRTWMVSWAGASALERLSDATGPLADVRVGDFDGDRYADVFHADGQRWWVTYRGTAPRKHTQDSGFRVKDLAFADVNRDGRTDVVGVVSGRFMVSFNATEGWSDWMAGRANIADVLIADFNGDGLADLARSTEEEPRSEDVRSWTIRLAGTNAQPPAFKTPMPFAAVGRFDAAPGADLLFWGDDFLHVASHGAAPLARYSLLDMR